MQLQFPVSYPSPVFLSPWSEDWARIFAGLRQELVAACAPSAIVVEHIGSTAVPGLVAKPVIDVLLGAESLCDIESRINSLAASGFEYVSKYENEIPLRRYFVKQSPGALRVHVHGVERGADLWQKHLAFRDALRSDAGLCDKYQTLKLRLAREFADNKAAYTDAKAPFIQSVLARLL
jgi:GrpB-like predicted nucleotidyltransferase (UPF0157 family)